MASTVLVCDAEDETAYLQYHLLREAPDLVVDVTSDPFQAVESAARSRPDVVTVALGLEGLGGAELVRRLCACLADDPRRVARDGAHPVGLANGGLRDAVGSRAEQAAEAGAVQPGRRAPVAVDVGDHGRLDASELPGGERSRRFVAALRDDGGRPERAQLAREPERQRRVERGAVDAGDRLHEPELVVAALPARDDPEVELLADGAPLPLELRCER